MLTAITDAEGEVRRGGRSGCSTPPKISPWISSTLKRILIIDAFMEKPRSVDVRQVVQHFFSWKAVITVSMDTHCSMVRPRYTVTWHLFFPKIFHLMWQNMKSQFNIPSASRKSHTFIISFTEDPLFSWGSFYSCTFFLHHLPLTRDHCLDGKWHNDRSAKNNNPWLVM